MCILRMPVFVLHVTGFTAQQEAECIANEECIAKKMTAELNSQGAVVHMVDL